MCLGASNVSFGLPERHTLNAAFLAMGSAATGPIALLRAQRTERTLPLARAVSFVSGTLISIGASCRVTVAS